MTTKLMGERVPRSEDPRLVVGNGRYLDDLGHDALQAAFVRSPHAHARIIGIDVDDALDVEGLVAIFTYEDLASGALPGGRAAAAADPAPDAHPRPDAVRPGPRRGELRRRGDRDRGGDRPLRRGGRRRADPGGLRVPAPRRRDRGGPRAAEHLVHDDVPGNAAANSVQQNGDAAAAIDAARRTSSSSTWRSSAAPRCRMEGKGTLARWDADDESLTGVDLDADLDQRPRRRWRRSSALDLRPGRGGHPRRRRRLRREDRPSVAGGDAGAVRGARARAGR